MTVAADYMRSVLADYGLESLTDWAMDALARGLNENQVLQEMRKTPEFAQRFPAIIIRQEQGLPPLSPASSTRSPLLVPRARSPSIRPPPCAIGSRSLVTVSLPGNSRPGNASPGITTNAWATR